jgi:glycosyltransferase involved in cell wall biosynthesis
LWPPSRFHNAVARNAEAIVLHQQEGGRDTLERQGVAPSKIHIIPHGTPALVCASREDARASLHIPADAKVALFFGVMHRKKNLDSVIAAAAQVAPRLPGFRFVIAGRPRKRNVIDTLYNRRLERLMQPGISAGWLDLRQGFVPADAIADYLAAADVVLFPHDQRYGSASGVFHLALGAGRATICSASPKFGEAREIFGRHIPEAFAPTRNVDAWAKAMQAMLSNPPLLREAESLARAAAESTSWDEIAKQCLSMYAGITRRG